MNEDFDINANEETLSTEAIGQTAAAATEEGRTEVVGIRFKKNGRTYFFAPNGFTLKRGQEVIVDTSRGQEFGFTYMANRKVKNSEITEPLRPVVRLATEADVKIHSENKQREIDAFNTCIGLIDRHGLEMKLIDTELSFDRTKMLFYFSSENRVDFRELVRDLASTFHTRIEMRQIGIRDEAKILGGLGICGRPYCCSTFLSDFGQVSVKMAKEQSLSLNSAKISGSCGRLMCCLRYEYDTYLAEKALTPKVDTRVMTPSGAGVVVAANPLAGIVKVHLDSQGEGGDSVMFVREDVIEESKYEGQTLTKTDIPKRGERDDDIPSFASLSTSPASAPVEQTSAPVTPQNAESTPEQVKGDERNANHRRRNRHKHKKNKHGAQQNPQSGGQNQGKAPQNNGQDKGPSGGEQSKNPQGGDGQNAGKKKKKRFFKHYGKNGGKNGGGGQNQ